MIGVKSILVPTDFSICADAALDLALDFARRHPATIELLHVLESGAPPARRFGGVHPLFRNWEASMQPSEMGTVLSLNWEGVDVRCRVIEATDASDVILETVQQDIDLLVMGTHGLQSVRRFLNDTTDAWAIGQTARTVVPETRCPVLSVGPRGSRFGRRVDRVVVAIDLSRHAPYLLEQAAALAGLYEVPLTVLHVLSGGRARSHMSNADVRRHVTETVTKTVPSDIDCRIEFEEGRPAQSIIRFVGSGSGILLAVASHGHKPRGEVAIGSVANAVVRSAPCPVMALKTYGKSLLVRDSRIEERAAVRNKNTGADHNLQAGPANASLPDGLP